MKPKRIQDLEAQIFDALDGIAQLVTSRSEELLESDQTTEAFHVRGIHWVPVPDSGTCPTTYPKKQKFPGTQTDRCFTQSAYRVAKRAQEQEAPTTIQTLVFSKQIFKSKDEVRSWLKDHDFELKKPLDENEMSYRARQDDPSRFMDGSFGTTDITDGVKAVVGRLMPEFREGLIRPKNARGWNDEDTLLQVEENRRKFSQEEAGFKERSDDPLKVCGACRFYLRSQSSEIGACQVVEGPIPWFATSDLFIDAGEDAKAILESDKYVAGRGPGWKALKAGRTNLTEEERDLVMDRKAVWHHGHSGEASPAVWKSIVEGKTWFITNTHRAYNLMPTLKGAIERYHKFIRTTASVQMLEAIRPSLGESVAAQIIGMAAKPADFDRKGMTVPTEPLSGESALAVYQALTEGEKTVSYRVAIRRDGELAAIEELRVLTESDLNLRWVVKGKEDPLTGKLATSSEWRGCDDPALWDMDQEFGAGEAGRFAYENTFGSRFDETPKLGDILEVTSSKILLWSDMEGVDHISWRFPSVQSLQASIPLPDDLATIRHLPKVENVGKVDI